MLRDVYVHNLDITVAPSMQVAERPRIQQCVRHLLCDVGLTDLMRGCASQLYIP
jgi:hypothetical protein